MVVDTSGRDGWTVEHINSSVTSETGEADLQISPQVYSPVCSLHGVQAACCAGCLGLQHLRQPDS